MKSILSPRELVVVEHLIKGRTCREIAQCLKISPETVKTYLSRIRKKLGLRSKVEIAVWATRNKIIALDTCDNN